MTVGVKDMDANIISGNIHHAAFKDKLILFIGAGVSKNSGFQLWQDFVKTIDREINYTQADKIEDKIYSSDELVKIPQYLYDNDVATYNHMITSEYGKEVECENKIINTLLQLKPKHIITTNFDKLIEYSLQQTQMLDKPIGNNYSIYTKVAKDSDMIGADRSRFFIKMHGDTDNLEDLVLKEEDYLRYSESHSFIETFIKTLFIDHTFLFVGYGVNDYNLKLIMAWVDNIAKKYNHDEIRPKHYFVNSSNTAINAYEKKYLEKRNIKILEFNELPEEYCNQNIENMPDELGKNLQRCCNYICNYSTSYDAEKISKELSAFDKLPYIHFEDLLNYFNMRSHYMIMYKLNETLYYRNNNFSNSPIGIMCKTLIDDTDENRVLGKVFKELFLRCGIAEIVWMDEKTEKYKSIGTISQSEIYTAIFKNDFVMIREILERNDNINEYEKAFLKSVIGDEDSKTTYLKLFEEAVKQQNVYHMLISKIAFVHLMADEQDGTNINKFLPEECTRPYRTLNNYLYKAFNDECLSTFLICGKIVESYVKKDSPGLRLHSHNEFDVLRAKMHDLTKYIICNNIDISSKSVTVTVGRFFRCYEIYIETLCKLISPAIELKIKKAMESHEEISVEYNYYELTTMDLYILINLLKKEKVELLLEENKINNLKLSNGVESKEFLLTTLSNLGKEIFAINYNNDIFCNFEICIMLLKRMELDVEDYNKIITIIHNLFRGLFFRETKDNIVLYHSIVDTSISMILEIKQYNKNDEIIDGLVYDVLNGFICIAKNIEDNINGEKFNWISHYGWVIQLSQCGTHTPIVDDDRLKMILESRMIWFHKEKFRFLAAIYPYTTPNGQKLIQDDLKINTHRFQPNDIEILVFLNVLQSEFVIDKLLQLCDIQKDRNHVEYIGGPNFIYYTIAGLYQKGKLKDISVFKKYAQYNNFFRFVCFPEEFDYAKFKVEWYSWLSLEKYSKYIEGDVLDKLKPLFTEELKTNSDEQFKAVYYKLFFELEDDWAYL